MKKLFICLAIMACCRMSFSQDSLVLYCTFDDVNSITQPVNGLGGTFLADTIANFTIGKVGNAYFADKYDHFLVQFPKEVIPANKGCIEFWARLTNPPQYIYNTPTFFFAGNDPYVANYSYYLTFSWNNGKAGGGLCAHSGFNGFSATGYFENSYSYESIIGETNAWHHYALSWDINGVQGSSWRMQMYVDGIPHGSCQVIEGENWDPSSLPSPDGTTLWILGFFGFYEGSVAIDEFKIWNYAKTDFIDSALIYTSLSDTILCRNYSTVFEVKAVGISPIHYQWQKDNADIIGATESILAFTHVQTDDAGFYRCLASNNFGVDTSNTAELIVEFTDPSFILGDSAVTHYQVASYMVTRDEGHTYEFLVEGGNRISGTDTSITVQWGLPSNGIIRLIETNEIGCQADTVVKNVTIGSLGTIDARIYPTEVFFNSYNKSIIIRNFNEVSAVLIDLSGRILLYTRSAETDISALANGLYLLMIKDDLNNVVFYKKILKY